MLVDTASLEMLVDNASLEMLADTVQVGIHVVSDFYQD
jgi:hypothetical protein